MHVRFQGGDVEPAFANADHILDDTLRLHRHTATPLNRARPWLIMTTALNA